jgi:hypothetical protein
MAAQVTGDIQFSRPGVGMAATLDRGGYHVAAPDGGVFAYGKDACLGGPRA